jgi:GNAT superfamily N-acetyltransferase
VPEGYRIDEGVVLAAPIAEMAPPPRTDDSLVVRCLETELDWELAAIALHAAFGEHVREDGDALGRFVAMQTARYRALVAAGQGVWLGGFKDGEIAGVLGIFVAGDRLGRYQLVGTAPRFQRQGVCGRLVHAAAGVARERLGVDTVVIAADARYHAWRVYESAGLRPIERLVALRRGA